MSAVLRKILCFFGWHHWVKSYWLEDRRYCLGCDKQQTYYHFRKKWGEP